MRTGSLTSKKVAQQIAKFADDVKAMDIVVLDMRNVVNFCDYFVVCSGNTDRQVKAIADRIMEGLQEKGLYVQHKHGLKHSDWVVLDNGDVVTHIFEKNLRDFYRLEYLWQEAKVIDWQKK